MKVDYIVVGFGLAGMAFINLLENKGKSFVVFDDNKDNPARVVGGMYNPIILKRFTPAWMAHEMWQYALPFYQELEERFKQTYIKPFNIRRILHSVEEQNNWMVASDKSVMKEYMLPKIIKETIKGIDAPFGFGEMEHVGRVEGEQIVSDYTSYLIDKGLFYKEKFQYDKLNHNETQINYKDIEASHVVFSEGYQLPQNPFFNYLPMNEAKGEMLWIEVPDLKVDFTIKSGVFMVPFENNQYVVGATYNWDDKTLDATVSGTKELKKKLNKFLKVPYTVLGSRVGIRPTIKDRRPLIGKHPKYANFAVLNGLGTRGIIIAPFIAKELFNHLENNKPIMEDMHIDRFENLLA